MSTSAPPQVPCPVFEFLLTVTVSMGCNHTMHGTFGTRPNKPLLSGDVKDASGRIIGRIVPNTSASHGIVDAYGTYHPSVSMTVQWDVDGTFAYLNLDGIGSAGKPTSVYIHLEADTTSSYCWLNHRFLVGTVSHAPDGTHALFNIFILKENHKVEDEVPELPA